MTTYKIYKMAKLTPQNKAVLQKKGQAGFARSLVYMLVALAMAGGLASAIFTSLNSTSLSDAPAWVGTVVPILVGAGFVFAIMKVTGIGNK